MCISERTPEGVDAGFGFYAGQVRDEPLNRIASEKAVAILDPDMRDAAQRGIAKTDLEAKNRLASTNLIKAADTVQPTRTDWHDLPDVIVNAPLKEAANHASYTIAKNGDTDASLQVAIDLIKPESIDKLIEIAGDTNPILVSVHAEESVSVNWIPSAMAVVIRDKTGWDIDQSIVQSKKVGRTSAPDGFYRIAVTPTFAGEFPSGRTAIIMDDTLTQGGTLANLKGHIESQGGRVIGALALTGKQYSAKIAISVETLTSLRDQYGQLEEWFVGCFGYGLDKLTESEAKYILGSKKDAEFIKNRLIAAREGQRD
jgi:hypothetical protein